MSQPRGRVFDRPLIAAAHTNAAPPLYCRCPYPVKQKWDIHGSRRAPGRRSRIPQAPVRDPSFGGAADPTRLASGREQPSGSEQFDMAIWRNGRIISGRAFAGRIDKNHPGNLLRIMLKEPDVKCAE